MTCQTSKLFAKVILKFLLWVVLSCTKQSLHLIDRIYLTEVHAELEGDTYFPEYARQDWLEVERQDFQADEKKRVRLQLRSSRPKTVQ